MKTQLSISLQIIPFLLFASIILESSSVVESAQKEARHYLLKKPQCSEENLQKMEQLLVNAQSFGTGNRKLPETYDQLKAFCKETNKIVSKMEVFVKGCFAKEVKDLASLTFYSMRANMKRLCGKRNSKMTADLLKMTPCINKNMNLLADNRCMKQFINQTKVLINIADDKKKFPHLCCNFVGVFQCVEGLMNKVSCMRPHAGQLMDMIRSMSGSMSDMACGEYNDQTDACEKLGPPPKQVKLNENVYKSVALVIIELISSIKDPSTVPTVG